MVGPTYLAAVGIALAAAILLGAQLLWIRIGTEKGRADHAVFVVILVNLVTLTPLVLLYYYPDYGLTRQSWLWFIGAGILGTLLGRLCNYTSVDLIGASRTAPIVASWALVATVLGVIILDEVITPLRAVGIVLVVVGVAAIAWETNQENPDDLSPRKLAISLLIPFGAAFFYGVEPILAKYGFDQGTPAPVGLLVKTAAASMGFALYLRWQNNLPNVSHLRTTSTRWFLLAGVANTLFLLGYYVSLAIAPVNVITPIIITNTLFVVVLSAIFMPERLERVTWKLGVSATVIVVGILLITTSG